MLFRTRGQSFERAIKLLDFSWANGGGGGETDYLLVKREGSAVYKMGACGGQDYGLLEMTSLEA